MGTTATTSSPTVNHNRRLGTLARRKGHVDELRDSMSRLQSRERCETRRSVSAPRVPAVRAKSSRTLPAVWKKYSRGSPRVLVRPVAEAFSTTLTITMSRRHCDRPARASRGLSPLCPSTGARHRAAHLQVQSASVQSRVVTIQPWRSLLHVYRIVYHVRYMTKWLSGFDGGFSPIQLFTGSIDAARNRRRN